MSQSSSAPADSPSIGGSEENTHRSFPWDWFILPALSLVTLGCIVQAFRLIDNRLFVEVTKQSPGCIDFNFQTGVRGAPNCVSWLKSAEGELVEYRFNACGHRTSSECAAKPEGEYRIVLIGSSVAMGFSVPVRSDFASLLQGQLATETGRKIDVYNEGLAANHPRSIAMRFQDVLSAHPDLILWVVTPTDIERDPLTEELPFHGDPGIIGQLKWGIRQDLAAKSFLQVIGDLPEILRAAVSDSHIGMPTQHFLFESQSEFVRLSLLKGRSAGYLRTDSGAYWDDRVVQLNDEIGKIEAQAQSAGIPLATVLLPDRAQAAMISMGASPHGYDPYKLDNEIRSIVTSHGGIYLDILPGFHDIPNPEQYYLPVDGHPDARGHAIFASLLAQQLTSGVIPALNTAPASATARSGPDPNPAKIAK